MDVRAEEGIAKTGKSDAPERAIRVRVFFMDRLDSYKDKAGKSVGGSACAQTQNFRRSAWTQARSSAVLFL